MRRFNVRLYSYFRLKKRDKYSRSLRTCTASLVHTIAKYIFSYCLTCPPIHIRCFLPYLDVPRVRVACQHGEGPPSLVEAVGSLRALFFPSESIVAIFCGCILFVYVENPKQLNTQSSRFGRINGH